GDPLVHLEQVAVALADPGLAQTLDGVGEVEIHAEPAGPHAPAPGADLFRRPGGDVARREIAEAGVLPLQEVVPLILGDLARRAMIAVLLRPPDAAVVPERFAHERKLGLVIAAHRDAGRMDLGVAGVAEERPALVRTPDGGGVGAFGVGGKVEDVAGAAGAEDDSIAQ